MHCLLQQVKPPGCSSRVGQSHWPVYTADTSPPPTTSHLHVRVRAVAWEVLGDAPSFALAVGGRPQALQLSWPPHLSPSRQAASLGSSTTPSGFLLTFCLCCSQMGSWDDHPFLTEGVSLLPLLAQGVSEDCMGSLDNHLSLGAMRCPSSSLLRWCQSRPGRQSGLLLLLS